MVMFFFFQLYGLMVMFFFFQLYRLMVVMMSMLFFMMAWMEQRWVRERVRVRHI